MIKGFSGEGEAHKGSKKLPVVTYAVGDVLHVLVTQFTELCFVGEVVAEKIGKVKGKSHTFGKVFIGYEKHDHHLNGTIAHFVKKCNPFSGKAEIYPKYLHRW